MNKSIQKGYPFDGPKSAELFPNRLNPVIKDNKVGITINPDIFPDYFATKQPLTDFLLARVFDYHKALEVAEQQISDMQEEYPFIPEDFKFSVDKLPTETDDIFQKTYYVKGSCLMTRGEDDKWILAAPGISCQVSIPNASTAYTILKSLGVITDEEFGEEVFSYTNEDLAEPQQLQGEGQ